MKKSILCLLAACAFPFSPVYAEEDMFGIDDLLIEETSSVSVSTAKDTLSSYLANRIPAATARNINKAEKVFCYTVDYAPANYDGYMIDDLAVKGSCGELSKEGRDLIKDTLFQSSAVYSNSKAGCQISPKIILRYVHGLEHTDVLISDTCPALTFFRGREITTVNAAPGAAVLEQIVKAYSGLEEKFYSPALLGQMVGNGQPQTQAQKEIIRLNAPAESPRKKWGNESAEPDLQPTRPAKPQSGWNKLKQ